MKLIYLCLVFVISTFAHAVNEPQTVDPAQDQKLLAHFPNLYVPGNPVPARFNLLFVGQDDPLNKYGARNALTSRSDIIMVLSTEIATKKITVVSIYRDEAPTAACTDRIGQNAPDGKINGVYSIGGRRMFIPCLEGTLEENIKTAGLDELLDENGHFPIHAFFEGTRSHTISPVGHDALGVVENPVNWIQFVYAFGTSPLGAALSVLTSGGPDALQKQINATTPPDLDNDLDFKYLSVELKERHIYQAGGYQRAFNFAYVISDILGWAAVGIEHGGNNEFLGYYFGDTINKNFSRSIDFKDLEHDVYMQNGTHAFLGACYVNNQTPVKIVQWGEDKNDYAIFENGKFTRSRKDSLLKFLKIVDILPVPPGC